MIEQQVLPPQENVRYKEVAVLPPRKEFSSPDPIVVETIEESEHLPENVLEAEVAPKKRKK